MMVSSLVNLTDYNQSITNLVPTQKNILSHCFLYDFFIQPFKRQQMHKGQKTKSG